MTGSLPTKPARPVSVSFQALGTTAVVVVTEPGALPDAQRILRTDLDRLDLACSRFRPDSEIARLVAAGGRPVRVSPLLADAIATALRAARVTAGLVDPTVQRAIEELGYDRDFAAILPDAPAEAAPAAGAARAADPVPGWQAVEFDPATRTVRLPDGVGLDLGATAKALAADRAADRINTALDCGVLVSLGGDLAVAGPAPDGDWRIEIGDDHTAPTAPTDPIVTIRSGGLATSSVTRRSWRRGGRTVHHIVDPRTGTAAEVYWRTVSVAAASCADANTASTGAIVLGEAALSWLGRRRLAARLVRTDGLVATTAGWPTPIAEVIPA